MKIPSFIQQKGKSKISMITCYDTTFAKIIEQSDINAVLVGDSVGMVVYGHEDTLSVDVDMIARHVAAVRKGFTGLIVADIPFLEAQKDKTDFIESVKKIISAGAQAVKIEGYKVNEDYLKALIGAGVPVMGHVGLTPQYLHQFGGFKVQGKSLSQMEFIEKEALGFEEVGCFGVVFECIPWELAQDLTSKISIPTIGIGAGNTTDGQILVLHDLLGLNSEFKPRFVRNYSDGKNLALKALNDYVQDVADQSFPNKAESFEIPKENQL